MLIKKLILENFLSHEYSEIDFSATDLAVLTGDNGAGKSSCMDAVNYALFGVHRNSDGKKDIDTLIRVDQDKMSVTLEWNSEGTNYSCTRSKTRGGGQILEVWVDKEQKKKAKIAEAQEIIEKAIGVTPEIWSMTVHASQDRSSLLLAKATQRKQIFSKILGLEIYKEYEEKAKAFQKTLEGSFSFCSNQLASIEESLGQVSEKQLQVDLSKIAEELFNKENKAAELNQVEKQKSLMLETMKSALATSLQKVTKITELTQLVEKRKKDIERVQAQLSECRITSSDPKYLERLKLQRVSITEEKTRLEAELRKLEIGKEKALQIDSNLKENASELEKRIQSNNSELSQLKSETAKIRLCKECGQEIKKESFQKREQILVKQLEELTNRLSAIIQKREQISNKLYQVTFSIKAKEKFLDESIRGESTCIAEIQTLEKKLDSIVSLEANLVLYKELLAKEEQELQSVEKSEENIEHLREMVSTLTSEVEVLRREGSLISFDIKDLIGKKTKSESQLSLYKQNKETLKKLQKEKKELEQKLDDSKTLVKSFSLSGIPFKILENTLPIIEDKTNEILKRLNCPLEVQFNTVKETRTTNKISDTLDILIKNQLGKLIPAENCSGGEKLRLDLSLRVALAEYLALKSNTSTLKTLFLDEYFSSLDEDGKQKIVEILEDMVTKLNLKVVFITHCKDLQDAGKTVFHMEKENGITTVVPLKI